MKIKLQFLWENVSDHRQFEETHTKTHEEKSAIFVENVSDQRQFEETHKKYIRRKKCNFCGKIFQAEGNLKNHNRKTHQEKIATFVGKFFKPKAI